MIRSFTRIGAFKHRLRRFRKEEDGSPTLEFAIIFPLFIFALMSSVELGFITMRHTLLERAMDLTVRDIRLGTGTAPQHDQIKQMICDRAAMINDCENNLKLEMIRVDLRNWSTPSRAADCTDQSEPVEPVRSFTNGMDNELMILRACAKFKPVIKLSGLGRELEVDGAGFAAMVATAAFVQEPR